MVYKKHGMKKKYEHGEATQYISRKNARKKLQLTLADFRRLCILKGVYPREPRHRKKAGKGSTSNRTYYFVKDIQYLTHEPLIEKFRAHKAFLKKMTKAEGRRDWDRADRVRTTKPNYRFDHIVLERYPSFPDALRDLDDALSLIFLFRRMPKSSTVHAEMIANCRRLAHEWLNYCIHQQVLKKVFVSIKGYYYQVEIKGETITWLVPHQFATEHNEDVDYRVMRTFSEFYCSLLGFIMYRLYTDSNLKYPPHKYIQQEDQKSATIDEQEAALESLTLQLRQQSSGTETDDDVHDVELLAAEVGDESIKKSVENKSKEEKRLNIFKGLKIYISRECPREPLAFVIRSYGGLVSWNSSLYPGATFELDDDSVTHLIIDRPTAPSKLGRQAVQPQWIFDSINFNALLPPSDYVPGAELPPHLSPFVSSEHYQPPEVEIMERKARGQDPVIGHESDDDDQISDEEDDDEDDLEDDDLEGEENDEKNGNDESTKSEEPVLKKKKVETEVPAKKGPNKRAVKSGKRDANLGETKFDVDAEAKKLAKSAQTNKKRKRLLERIEFGEKKKRGRINKLTEKRAVIDADAKKKQKAKKRKALS